MPGKLGLTLEEAKRLMERSAMKVVEVPKEARGEALVIVEDSFRKMYVVSGAGEDQTREAVEALMKGVRLLIDEMDTAGTSGGGHA